MARRNRLAPFFAVLTLLIALSAGLLPTLAQGAAESEITLSEPTELALAVRRNSMTLMPVLALSSDGSLLATFGDSADGAGPMVQLWDAVSGRELAAFDMAARVNALAFSSDARLLAMAGDGGNVVVFDVATLRTLGRVADSSSLQEAVFETSLLHSFILLGDDYRDVMSLAFSADNDTLLIYGDLPTAVSLWDIREALDHESLSDAAPPPNPPQIPLVMDGEEVRFQVNSFHPTSEGFSALSFADDAHRAYSIVVDQANSSASLRAEDFSAPRMEADIALWSAEGSTLLSYSSTQAQVYRAGEGQPITLDLRPDAALVDAALSADGTLVATVHRSGEITLWDVAGTAAQQLFNESAPNRIEGVLFSADATTLVMTARDRLYIWKLSGPRIAAAQGEGPTPAVTPPVTPDGSTPACEIDLSATAALLVRAQAAATAGDSATVVELLAEAREQLAAFEAQCSGGTVETPPTLNLPQSHTLNYSRDGITLTFNYPAGWVLEQDNRTAATVASAAEYVDAMDSAEPPALPSGVVIFNVGVTDVRDWGGTGDLGNSPSAADLVETLFAGAEGQLTQTGDIQTVQIADRPAAMATFATGGVDGLLMMVELRDGDPYRVFGHIIFVTAKGELDVHLPLANAVAASFTVAAE